MTALTIRHCTYDDIAARPDLLAEYAAESAIPELGTANPQADTYRLLEASGVLHVIGAYADDELVGFIALLIHVLPHFGQCVAVTESYFVASHARKTGAGIKLLYEAERFAAERGAVGILVSAPFGGRLEKVLPGNGYRQTNSTFFRRLNATQH